MAAPPKVSVMLLGLDLTYAPQLDASFDVAKFGAIIDMSIGTLDHVPNLYIHRFQLDPHAPVSASNSMAAYSKLCVDGPPHGGRWSGVFVGFGLRTLMPMTEVFEQVVNDVVLNSKGQTKLLFGASGDDHWGVVRRNFPELEMGENPQDG